MAKLDDLISKAYAAEGLTRDDILGDKGAIPTGNLAFDHILGGRGVPKGRTVEFFGPSQSAKTTAALEVAVQCQRAGGVVVYLDFEQALDTAYMRSVGLDVDDEATFKPFPASTLEAGMSLARQVVETGEVGLVIFDSVPAMQPASASGSEDQSRTMAMERARLLGGGIAALNPMLARTGTIAIFINHERDVINTTGMPQRGVQKTTAGGTALKYYASVRVRFSVVRKIVAEAFDPLTGAKVKRAHSQVTRVSVEKNKVDAPHQAADLYVRLGVGFNQTWSALTVLMGAGRVSLNGSWLKFPAELYHPQMNATNAASGKFKGGGQVQGLNAALDLAEFDPEWLALLVAAAHEVLATVDPTAVGALTVAEVPVGAGAEDLPDVDDEETGDDGLGFTPRQGGRAGGATADSGSLDSLVAGGS